jgi:3-oxoadipate enol-lactonase
MTDVAYSDLGAGPTVVLVHGFVFNRSMWAPQLDVLAHSGHRVVAVDLRGFGDTPAHGTTIPMSAHSADILSVLDELGIATATFVGYSMGGQVVMDLVANHPERVAALVFSDTFAGLDSPDGKRSRLELADRLESEGTAAFAVEFVPQLLGERTREQSPATTEQALAMIRSTDGASAAAALRGRAHRPDYRDTVSSVSVPTLVIVGQDDVFDRGVLASELAASIPGAQLVTLPELGHTPNMEAPDLFNSILTEFLAENQL